MFTLDAELGSERCNFNDQKQKNRNQESIANVNKSKNTDIEQKTVQRAKKMRQTLFTRTKKSDVSLVYNQSKIFQKL